MVARLSAQSEGEKARGLLRVFIPQPDIKALNATGPRANTGPDVAEFVTERLTKAPLPFSTRVIEEPHTGIGNAHSFRI
jgi:hypothetical protein